VPAVGQLREREVEAALRPGARAHRGAEARPAGLAAVDGDDEDAFPPLRVVAFDVAALEEDAVLDRDRVEIARARAEECERTVGRRLLLDRGGAAVRRRRPPEAHPRGQQLLLPRVRADSPAEHGVVLAPLDPVRRRLVVRGPAVRELVGRRDLVEHDRAVANGRADDPVALLAERIDQQRQPLGGHQIRAALGSRELVHVLPRAQDDRSQAGVHP
jgi:hypothetical protein